MHSPSESPPESPFPTCNISVRFSAQQNNFNLGILFWQTKAPREVKDEEKKNKEKETCRPYKEGRSVEKGGLSSSCCKLQVASCMPGVLLMKVMSLPSGLRQNHKDANGILKMQSVRVRSLRPPKSPEVPWSPLKSHEIPWDLPPRHA